MNIWQNLQLANKNCDKINVLKHFYQDQTKYSTIFQVLVNETRYTSFKEELNKYLSKDKPNIVLIDRSVQATQFFINILINEKKINTKNA